MQRSLYGVLRNRPDRYPNPTSAQFTRRSPASMSTMAERVVDSGKDVLAARRVTVHPAPGRRGHVGLRDTDPELRGGESRSE